jgi:poly(A) polymerase
VRAASLGLPPPEGWQADVQRGARMQFPVTAADLAPLAGAELGERLAVLKERWLQSGMALTRKDLLA